MTSAAVKVAKRETQVAEDVVKAHGLPAGVRHVTIEPGEDHDGDPVMWVWYEVEEPNRQDHARVVRLLTFTDKVRDDLFQQLEEYRPHVGIR
jgi:hypothetical protein